MSKRVANNMKNEDATKEEVKYDEGEQSEEFYDDDEDDSRSESSSRIGSNPDAVEEEEGEEGYRVGGYHRVAVNDVMGGKWRVEKKLGWGHFSTVWLVRNNDGIPAALKVQKSASHYTEAAKDEIKLLRTCQSANDTEHSGKRFIVRLFDSFSHLGPNGEHMVMVFEVLGDNLLALVDYYEYKGIPLKLVRQITWQICAGLDFLHRQAQIIHCDLKLENILIAGLSANYARSIADGMPCVVTLRADATAAFNNDGQPSTPFSSAMLLRKEATLKSKIQALETSLTDLKGPERRNVKKKVGKLQEQLNTIKGERMHRDGFNKNGVDEDSRRTKPLLGTSRFEIDTMVDDDETDDREGGWQVVQRSGSNRSLGSTGSAQSLRPPKAVCKLIPDADLLVLGNELWRRNLEFSHFPAFFSTSGPARRTSVCSSPRSSRPSTPRSSRPGTPRSPSRTGTPKGASLVSGLRSPMASPTMMIRSLSLDDRGKAGEEVERIAGIVASVDQVEKLVQRCQGEKREGPLTDVVLRIKLEVADPDQVFVCKLHEVGGGQEVDLGGLREAIKSGQRTELGLERERKKSSEPQQNRRHSRNKRSNKDTAKESSRAKLWAVSCKPEMKTLCLQRIEEYLPVTFLFSPKPLASTFPESTILGIPNQVALVSTDMKPRPVHARSELPPPLPRFVGTDLGITSQVDITVKIVDLGNACWTFKHFSDDIQTRQYRAPEVILNAGYDCSADIWSLGCIIVELITGDLLFDPVSGKDYSRDEDHLALITELMGPIPLSAMQGPKAKIFYDKKGNLLHVKDLYYSSLEKLLETTYRMEPPAAQRIASFLNPCFTWDPKTRVTAGTCLKHPFINGLVG